MRKVFWWHLAYATNFRVALDAATFPDQGGFHFWTLAVEEQFYLIWPALILLVPRRHVLKTIFLALAGGLVFRVVCVLIGQRGAAGVWPFACFDLFAFGAALAAFGDDSRYHETGATFCRWCTRLGMPALLILLAAGAWHLGQGKRDVLTANLLLDPLAAGAVFAALIARTARGFAGVGKAVLESAPCFTWGESAMACTSTTTSCSACSRSFSPACTSCSRRTSPSSSASAPPRRSSSRRPRGT